MRELYPTPLHRCVLPKNFRTAKTSSQHLAHLGLIILLAAGVVLPVAKGQPKAQETIPLIQMENVPLKDAIRNLARQAGLNYILDPKLEGPWQSADGKPGREPSLSAHWENLTAEQALGKVLKEHGLVMIVNPATSVTRIAFTNEAVKPVPNSVVARGTNDVIPLIVMDSVPLPDALRNLAKQAHLNLMIDSAMPTSLTAPGRRTISDYTLSIRWENVTATQALAAILDNYNLMLVQDPTSGIAKIATKP